MDHLCPDCGEALSLPRRAWIFVRGLFRRTPTMEVLPGTELLLQAAAKGAPYLLLTDEEWSALDAWHTPFLDGLADRWICERSAEAAAASSAAHGSYFVGTVLTVRERALLAAMATSNSFAVRHLLSLLSLGSGNASVAEAGGVNNLAGGSQPEGGQADA